MGGYVDLWIKRLSNQGQSKAFHFQMVCNRLTIALYVLALALILQYTQEVGTECPGSWSGHELNTQQEELQNPNHIFTD